MSKWFFLMFFLFSLNVHCETQNSGGGDAIRPDFTKGARSIIADNPHYLKANQGDLRNYTEILRKIENHQIKLISVGTSNPNQQKNINLKDLCAQNTSSSERSELIQSLVKVDLNGESIEIVAEKWSGAEKEVKEYAEVYALMRLNGYSSQKISRTLSQLLKDGSYCSTSKVNSKVPDKNLAQPGVN